MFLTIIIALLAVNCSARSVLKKSFPLCELTREVISNEEPCNSNDIECYLFMSQIEYTHENTFNKIEIMNSQIVVYKQNNKVYNTNCQMIHEVVIEQGNAFTDKNTCSQLLPVKFDNEKQVAFLRKDGILVKDYEGTKCPVQDEVFLLDDIEFLLSGI
jgi:hypothetical protein